MKRSNKFGAKKTVVEGITFSSKDEARRYTELILLQRAGEISLLELQPGYDIYINNIKICAVILDFRYIDKEGKMVIEDVKGMDNPLSKLKRKMVEAQEDITVELIKYRGRK